MYGSNDKALVEVTPLGVGIHQDIEIESIKALKTEPNKVGKTYDILDIVFINPVGKSHRHRIFSPEGQTDANKKAKQATASSNFIAYLATKVTGTPSIVPQVESWEEFAEESIKLLGDYAGKKFQLKLLGNVYNNKANVQLPGYTGWIEPQASDKRLEFTPSEKKGNLEYKAFYETVNTSKPSSGGNGGNAEGDDLPF